MISSQLDLLHEPSIAGTFEDIARAAMGLGRGLTLKQIGTCDALAREVQKDAPDPRRVVELAERLGLDANDLEVRR